MENEHQQAEGCQDRYAKLGLYPIGVVASLTGISIHTLRAWERRYGLPRPSRTAGTHRLYDINDIALLRRVQQLTLVGTPASRACAYVLAEPAEQDALATTDVSAQQFPARELRLILVQAFIELDEEVADRVLGEVLHSLGPEAALREVLFPALVELGAAWHDGHASVAAEHFGSGLIRARLLAAFGSCAKTVGHPVALIGAAPNEQHDIPPLVLAILLRRRGWQSVFLGSGMPFEALVDAVMRKRPHLVCLSSSTCSTVPGLVDALMRMRCLLETESVTLTYGGLPFRQDPRLREPLAGVATYLGDDLTTAAGNACALLNRVPPDSTIVTN